MRSAKVEKETGKLLTVGFQPRYDGRMRKIKGNCAKAVFWARSTMCRPVAVAGAVFPEAFIEKRYAGVGCLADIGCYSLDMVLNALGYPKPLTVSATAFNYFGTNPKYNKPEDAARFNVDDFCGAFIRLEGGITLDFRTAWAMHMDTTGATIFLGTDAGLKVEPAGTESHYGGAWDGSCGPVTLFHDKFDEPTSTPIPLHDLKEDRFYLKCRSFVDAVKENLPAPSPPPRSFTTRRSSMASFVPTNPVTRSPLRFPRSKP